MPFKQLVTAVLLVFVVGCLGYLLIGQSGIPPKESTPELTPAIPSAENVAGEDKESQTKKPDRRLVAYYFHGAVRCPTCLAIEDTAQQALKDSFPDEIASGTLEWRAVNTDEVWNSHYWKDFDLSFSSLVIADVSGEATIRFKNLVKVWELVNEKEAFLEYVRTETESFLEAL